MLKKLFQKNASWHIMYLCLFYASMTFTLLFLYLVAQSRKWISIPGDVLHRTLFNGTSSLSKTVLLVFAIFFVLNTIYLIQRKQ